VDSLTVTCAFLILETMEGMSDSNTFNARKTKTTIFSKLLIRLSF